MCKEVALIVKKGALNVSQSCRQKIKQTGVGAKE